MLHGSSWLRQHPARRITVDKIGELFNPIYMKTATMESAVSGFRCTGIVPFNCNILPASEFLVDPRESPIVTSNNDLSIHETESLNTSSIPPLPSSEPTPTSTQLTPNPTSSTSSSISFNDILKVPVIVEKVKPKRSEESQIITSSPYKRLLESSIEKKQTKDAKQTKKIIETI